MTPQPMRLRKKRSRTGMYASWRTAFHTWTPRKSFSRCVPGTHGAVFGWSARRFASVKPGDGKGGQDNERSRSLRKSLPCLSLRQFVYHEDLELKAEAQKRKVATYLRAAPHLDPPAERVEIPYPVSPGRILPGILRIPEEAKKEEGGAPCVVLVAGLDSTKEEFHTLEEVLHKRGMATFAFDGPAQGKTPTCRCVLISRT